MLKFATAQDGPGFAVASGISASLKHKIEYMPWVRAFRVTHTNSDGTSVGFIPEHRVSCWYPVE